MPCHYRISLQGISYEVGASRKSLGFRANKKTTFVCKDFEARDSSLNEGSSSFSLKSQRTSSPYYNDSRVWLKSRGTQGLLSSFYPSSSTNIYINHLKNLADTFKLSPNYLQQAEPCINSNELPDLKKWKWKCKYKFINLFKLYNNLTSMRYANSLSKNRRNRWETISISSSSKRGGSIRNPFSTPRRDNSRCSTSSR